MIRGLQELWLVSPWWIGSGDGGVAEDQFDGNSSVGGLTRSPRHFHTPRLPWDRSGLDIPLLPRFESSVRWAQLPDQGFTGRAAWKDARTPFSKPPPAPATRVASSPMRTRFASSVSSCTWWPTWLSPPTRAMTPTSSVTTSRRSWRPRRTRASSRDSRRSTRASCRCRRAMRSRRSRWRASGTPTATMAAIRRMKRRPRRSASRSFPARTSSARTRSRIRRMRTRSCRCPR